MPVLLLVAVLLLSAAANLALLAGLSRAGNARHREPNHHGPAVDATRARPSEADAPAHHRRSLYVSEGPYRREPATSPSTAFSSVPGTLTTRPLCEVLPPELADLLSTPAAIASEPSEPSEPQELPEPRESPESSEDDDGPGVLARVPAQPSALSSDLALDPLTGLEGPAAWDRLIELENARFVRYRRPATVVIVEVEGLRRLAEKLGNDPVERVLPVIADAFRREARAADLVARIGDDRFAAFLPETDEIQAINYIERVRLVCEPWLASSAVPLRLTMGWSGPTASSDLEYALSRAEERMHADRRMSGISAQLPRGLRTNVVAIPREGPAATDSADPEEDPVSPAETGRWGDWIGAGTPLDQVAGPVADVWRGNRRREQPQVASSPDRRNET